MTLPVATNCWTKAEDDLRIKLAQNTAARAFLEATDVPTALGRIFVDALPRPADKEVYTDIEWAAIQRAHILIGTETEDGFAASKVADFTMDFTGVLWFQCKRVTTAAEDADTQYLARTFKNEVGDILECLRQQQYAPPEIMDFAVSGPITPVEEQEEGNAGWIAVEVRVSWGLSGSEVAA